MMGVQRGFLGVQRGLFQYLWRKALPATLLGGLGLAVYALASTEVLTRLDSLSTVIVAVQCLGVAYLLGNYRSPAFAYLYSRGYSRDVIWNHLMLASLALLLAAWLPAALIVWTGLRSMVHDRLFQSPNFPVMAPLETSMPFWWLGFALLTMPLLHYVWIRQAQPTRGGQGGKYAGALFLFAVLASFPQGPTISGYAWFFVVADGVVVVGLVIGGRILHRSMEVRA
jgi:hypothetical protein